MDKYSEQETTETTPYQLLPISQVRFDGNRYCWLQISTRYHPHSLLLCFYRSIHPSSQGREPYLSQEGPLGCITGNNLNHTFKRGTKDRPPYPKPPKVMRSKEDREAIQRARRYLPITDKNIDDLDCLRATEAERYEYKILHN